MATGALDANGIWQYGEDDSETTFSGLLNKLGESVSDKFTGGLPVVSGGTGATSLAAAQDSLGVGLVSISPISVAQAGGSASANSLGLVTFTGVTSVSLNGAFTDTYKKYRFIVEINAASSNAALRMRYRASGVDNTSAIYSQGGLISRISGATVNLSAVLATEVICGAVYPASGYSYTWIFDVVGARSTTNRTAYNWVTYHADANSSVGGFAGGDIAILSAFDGFTLFPATGNMTGKVQVFGYNE